jgi:hypothetical protein
MHDEHRWADGSDCEASIHDDGWCDPDNCEECAEDQRFEAAEYSREAEEL